jgi:uncharacterized protein YjdB
MKQKLFFLMLTLLFLSVTSMNAQVQIGGTAGPNSSAILDLNPDEGDATLGLKLPVIALGDVSVFQLSGPAEDADGITVYNSSDATTGGSGKGIYVWEGKWVFTGKSGQIIPVENPVTNITITSAGDVVVINSGDQLQLTAHLEPTVPTNPILNWTIVYDPAVTAGSATIDGTGLITAVRGGLVTARATATDGSGVYRNFVFDVIPGEDEVPEIAVTKIRITSDDDITYVNSGSDLQLTATVEPDNATNKTLKWTIGYDPAAVAGSATVDQTGKVTGVKVGNVTVRATAADGYGAYRTFPISVRPTTIPTAISVTTVSGLTSAVVGRTVQMEANIDPVSAFNSVMWSIEEGDETYASVSATGLVTSLATGTARIIATSIASADVTGYLDLTFTSPILPPTTGANIGTGNYQTYKFGTTWWMVENSHEGTWDKNYYGDDIEKVDYYYAKTNALTACAGDWSLPTLAQANELIAYLSLSATEEEKNLWMTPLHGMLGTGIDAINWDQQSLYPLAQSPWIVSGDWLCLTTEKSGSMSKGAPGAHRRMTIRCVLNE